MIPLSLLDLCPITEGGSATESFRHTVDLARHAERWGFNRYWMAEHHGMPGIASANSPRWKRCIPDGSTSD